MKVKFKNYGKIRPTIEGAWNINQGYDLLSIVNNGSNKSYISKKDVPAGILLTDNEYWELFGYSDIDSNSIIYLSNEVNGEIISYSLEEAIATIDETNRRSGLFISFYEKANSLTQTNRWNIYQFVSNDLSQWNDITYWDSLYYNETKFIGAFLNEDALWLAKKNPKIGDYAYVGATLGESIIYRCNNTNNWSKTEEKATDYITVSIKGLIEISEDGYWIIEGTNTGVKATGPQGEKGDKGDKGEPGKDGTSVSILGSYENEEQLREEHPTGNVGDAYLVNGDLYVWLKDISDWKNAGSIKGPKGDKGDIGEQGIPGEQGIQGEKGDAGADGKSAYQIWLDAGNEGSEEDFIAFLKGEKGDKGDKGEKGDKGDKGDTGDIGPQGPQGEPGVTFPDAPTNDNIYGRKNKQWEVIKNITSKEEIEKVFTGNIESHTHDTTYKELVYETDVWDGSTIATSVQGKGTKEEPYLISSCAEWIYFWNNSDALVVPFEGNPQQGTKILTYIKLIKSLDFNNKPINYVSQEKTLFCDIDGGYAIISNFIVNSDIYNISDINCNLYGLANTAYYSYFHNFNLVNIQFNIDITNATNDAIVLDIFASSMNGMIGIGHINNYIDAKITINGNITKTKTIIINETGFPIYALIGHVNKELLQNIYKDKIVNFGTNINITDNTVKSDGITLNINRSILLDDKNNSFNCIGNGYILSNSNVINYVDQNPVVDDGETLINALTLYTNIEKSNIYYCTDTSHGYIYGLDSNINQFITNNGKTKEELNSDEFINILNKNGLIFKKGIDSPTIITTTTDYDGYVRQTLFDNFKESIKDLYNPFVFIDEDINGSINNASLSEEQMKAIFGKTYDVVTKDNIIEKLGGIEGVKKLYEQLNIYAVPKFVCFPAMAYILPIITRCNYIVLCTDGSNIKTQSLHLSDGDSVNFIFDTVFNETQINVNINIKKFNTPEMTIEYTTTNITPGN